MLVTYLLYEFISQKARAAFLWALQLEAFFARLCDLESKEVFVTLSAKYMTTLTVCNEFRLVMIFVAYFAKSRLWLPRVFSVSIIIFRY